jgi:hypothetical protein
MAPTLSDQDPPLQPASPWALVGLLVAVAVSSGGWWLAGYAAEKGSRAFTAVGAFMLIVTGSALLFYALLRMEFDDRSHLRRRRQRRNARRAA